MSVIGSNLLAGASGSAGVAGYEIERSLRFNSADSASLSGGFFQNTDTQTYTISFWVKRSKIGTSQRIYTTNANSYVMFNTSDQLHGNLRGVTGTNSFWYTNAVFRDIGAWYHIVVVWDTSNSTQANRLKVYVNGVEQTFTSTSFPSNAQHSGGTHTIGGTYYPDFYLSEFYYAGGQALAASDFGEFDANGVWQPIEYTGTYGTNGFHLDFKTPSDLGNDVSGNNNDWTPNNFGVGDSSQSWSNTTTPSNTSFQFPYTRGFDGTITGDGSTKGFAGWLSSAGDITITFPSGVSVSNTIDIYSGDGTNGSTTASITVNGSTTTSAAASGYVTTKSFSGVSGNLESITLTEDGGGVRFYGIAIDGVILIDPHDIDSLLDSPTNGTQEDTGAGGEVNGNYATLNPLQKGSSITLTNGNLDSTQSSDSAVLATIGVNSGKWYWETTIGGGDNWMTGLARMESGIPIYVGGTSDSYGYFKTGQKWNNAVGSSYGASYTTGDVIGTAFDADNGTLVFYKNGTSQGTAYTGLTSGIYAPAIGNGTTQCSVNFGQRPFAFSAPSGYKALCTANLDDPTIADGSDHFDVAVDTGANILSSTKALCGGNADFLWIKDRANGSTNHHLIDIVRDSQLDGTPFLASNSTSNEATLGTYSAPSGNSVGWAWDAGTSTVTNTDGSITSSVRANPSAGFSIVSYTGDGSTSATTMGHGLNAQPGMIIVKNRDDALNWVVLHQSFTDRIGKLNLPDAFDTGYTSYGNGAFDPAGSTSTVFATYPGTSTNNFGNALNDKYIAYCFAPVEGYSAFGSYTGNGSTDGPFVFTGHRSRWLMVKRTDSTGNWVMLDTARTPSNPADTSIYADDAAGDYAPGQDWADLLSNGFKVRATYGEVNATGATYVYVSFAEHPFASQARAR